MSGGGAGSTVDREPARRESRPATRHAVCRLDQLPPGKRIITTIKGRSIVVLHTSNGLFAIRNVCPHQGAELGLGTVGNTMVPSQPHQYVAGAADTILRCPWHGWEFSIDTGRSIFDPSHVRVKAYTVAVEDGTVIVEVP